MHAITRQKAVGTSTDLAHAITDTAMELWRSNWDARKPIRMLTVTAQNLVTPEEDVEQLELFQDEGKALRKKQANLERAMDAIRSKYGTGAIHSAGLLGNDLGISTDPEHENEKPSEFGPEEG